MDHIISNLQKEDALLEQEIATIQSKREQLRTAMAVLTQYGTTSSTTSEPTRVIEIQYVERPTVADKFTRANYGITHALEYIFRVQLQDGKSLQYTTVFTKLREDFGFTDLTNEAFENILNNHTVRGWIKKVNEGTKVSYTCGQRRQWSEDTPRIVTTRERILSRLKKN